MLFFKINICKRPTIFITFYLLHRTVFIIVIFERSLMTCIQLGHPNLKLENWKFNSIHFILHYNFRLISNIIVISLWSHTAEHHRPLFLFATHPSPVLILSRFDLRFLYISYIPFRTVSIFTFILVLKPTFMKMLCSTECG